MFSVEARRRAQFGTSPLEGARATGLLGCPSLLVDDWPLAELSMQRQGRVSGPAPSSFETSRAPQSGCLTTLVLSANFGRRGGKGGGAMAIVTISSELGAGGSEIGAALAKQLEYRYLDREVIAGAANRYGLAEAKLLRLDESKPSLFDRVDAEGRL